MGADYYDNKSNHMNSKIPLGIGKNCKIKKAIIDKNVRIGDNVVITPEDKPLNLDSEKYCIKDGIIIILKILSLSLIQSFNFLFYISLFICKKIVNLKL